MVEVLRVRLSLRLQPMAVSGGSKTIGAMRIGSSSGSSTIILTILPLFQQLHTCVDHKIPFRELGTVSIFPWPAAYSCARNWMGLGWMLWILGPLVVRQVHWLPLMLLALSGCHVGEALPAPRVAGH